MAIKFLGFSFGKSATPQIITTDSPAGYHSFSTPFGNVGKGDLSKPYVSSYYTGDSGFIRFGDDNLYPQLINQMYYTSPLNSSIIDFKVNAAISGKFRIDDGAIGGKEKVDEYTFIKKNKINKILKGITRNYVMHGRVHILIHFNDAHKPVKFELLPAEKVRVNANKTLYSISNDWSRGVTEETIKSYSISCKDKKQILSLEIDSPGQDFYPIPGYCTAFNWCFLDGQMSYFHKSNIQNSIFPSFALMLPKIPASKEEEESIKNTIEKAKGASEAGKAIVFAANGEELLPRIEAIPVNQNDTLFLQTDERVDGKICQAHTIDPILMGIRVSGKLGNGSDIKQSYTIFEKNIIMPLRNDIEELMNELMEIFGVSGDFVINEYQIIGDEITQTNEETK